MADIFEILRDLLCYGNNDCINLFNQYTYNPTEGLFYAVFFPTLFIIVFIYMLSNKLFSHQRGLKILVSVAFLAFIILQGWYYLFAMLGRIWYIALIILGFFWLALYGLRGGIGTGGGGGAHARDAGTFGGLGSALGKRALARVTGREHRLLEEIKLALDEVDALVSAARKGQSGAWRMAPGLMSRLHELRAKLEEMQSVGGFAIGDFNHWDRRIKDAIHKLHGVEKTGVKKEDED
jgi:hypothetical protein